MGSVWWLEYLFLVEMHIQTAYAVFNLKIEDLQILENI